MNWKGYVQIIPTDEQVKRLEQAIKRADAFLKDIGLQMSLEEKCSRIVTKGIFVKREVKVLHEQFLLKLLPLGVFAEFIDYRFCDYHITNEYRIMKDIQQMIQAGSPLYLDNEMVKVWNKVQEEL